MGLNFWVSTWTFGLKLYRKLLYRKGFELAMANALSFIILLLLIYGRSLANKNRVRHVWIMSSAIAMDLLLVAYLSIERHALGQVKTGMPWTLKVHLPFAVTTVLGYFACIYVGSKLLKGQEKYRPAMRWLDHFIIPLRIMTLVTSLLHQLLQA